MDKKAKLILIIAIIAIVISGSINVVAVTYLYAAKDVSYNNNVSKLESTDVQDAIDELNGKAEDYERLNKKIWPVGSIYISVTDNTVEKVEERLGGTWVAFGSGKTLVGYNSSETEFDTIEETGGAKSVTLTANQSGIQAHNTTSSGGITNGITGGSHSHQIAIRHGDGTRTTGEVLNAGLVANVSDGRVRHNTAGATHTHTLPNHVHSIAAANAKEAHTNLQPYITVYMYKRTE